VFARALGLLAVHDRGRDRGGQAPLLHDALVERHGVGGDQLEHRLLGDGALALQRHLARHAEHGEHADVVEEAGHVGVPGVELRLLGDRAGDLRREQRMLPGHVGELLEGAPLHARRVERDLEQQEAHRGLAEARHRVVQRLVLLRAAVERRVRERQHRAGDRRLARDRARDLLHGELRVVDHPQDVEGRRRRRRDVARAGGDRLLELLDEAPVDVEVEEAVVDDAVAEALDQSGDLALAPFVVGSAFLRHLLLAAQRRRHRFDGRGRSRSGRLDVPQARKELRDETQATTPPVVPTGIQGAISAAGRPALVAIHGRRRRTGGSSEGARGLSRRRRGRRA